MLIKRGKNEELFNLKTMLGIPGSSPFRIEPPLRKRDAVRKSRILNPSSALQKTLQKELALLLSRQICLVSGNPKKRNKSE